MKLHLQEAGEGAPAVVLDSALGGSSMSWFRVQPEVSRFTRVLAHDRAGFGWSGRPRRPRTAEAMADELDLLLRAAATPPPFVLVGHSYGSLVCLLYASRYPKKVCGLVLVDPPDVDSWSRPDAHQAARIARGARLARLAAFASRFGLMRLFFFLFGLRAGPAARLVSLGSSRPDRVRIFQVLERLPPGSRAALRWFWSEPGGLDALASLIENVPASARRVAWLQLPRDLPWVVLTAADAPPAQKSFHERLAAHSTGGRHRLASRSGHWIPLEEPELVVEACRDLVTAARDAQRAAKS